eukprot:Blabericola_migrator_1__39@NODE_100_length_14362_cov_139_136341_g85_i1_p7_GENE_NODE_100_length_14362_cov_139_136341_g85_i1NODE_100_length_14362_cov_139_136341_g85_i1_p7_ORF_typecomplete_len353_score52_63ATP_bind_1/PF03029_17/4_2e70AAA_33/PF13671_6/0_00087Mg_chelatase/PF01078_21/0_0016AAA_18/PF13238_6/0_0056PRK/PF00485_18/0_0048AAA_17/PF13207_6/0_0064AP_endonuc_2/PF01261_24/0_95AP_endonuc_2/PF01261_24/74AAA_29/PF13555_6/0_021PduVEutP/PF10662_9/0_5PduVEutP/PF10662_9/1_5e02AAA_5/PF07728_14/0_02ADK/
MKRHAVGGVDFGQLVIGPPGSGKTTYCEGMHQLLTALGRAHLRINLDFANDWITKEQYRQEMTAKSQDKINVGIVEFSPPDVDVRDLITVDQAMKEKNLGPNGALIYCNKLLASKADWLKNKIQAAKKTRCLKHAYLLFDMPGQVELYAHDDSISKIIDTISDGKRTLRLAAVHLVDSTLCVQPHQYLSALLVTITAQIALELPFINVFTKVDLLDDENRYLKFPLEYFARAEDLNLLLPEAHPAISTTRNAKYMEREKKFAQFHEAICEAADDFNIVSFVPLAIEDKELCMSVLAAVDQSNGYSMSAYLPPSLCIPGIEGVEETRLPVDPTMRYHGSKWFDKISDATCDDY